MLSHAEGAEDGTGSGSTRFAAVADIEEVLATVVLDHSHSHSGSGGGAQAISRQDIYTVCEMLSHPLSPEEYQSCMDVCDPAGSGLIPFDAFVHWYNSAHANPNYHRLTKDMQQL